MWQCPNCDSLCNEDFCGYCGYPSPSKGNPSTPSSSNVASGLLSRMEIKQKAKIAITSQQKTAILLWLAALGIGFATGLITGFIFGFIWFLVLPLVCILFLDVIGCGEHYAGVRLYLKQPVRVKDLFHGFSNYGHVLGGLLWRNLWLFLWGLIPVMGVIKFYSYSMMPYILMMKPELSAREALRYSIQITEGRKMDLFVLDLSFLGWRILDIMTCGILGILYVNPYYYTSWAGYYCELTETKTAPSEFWRCTNSACGHTNDAKSDYCAKCGQPKPKPVPTPPIPTPPIPTPPIPMPSKVWRCGVCGTLNEGDSGKCINGCQYTFPPF